MKSPVAARLARVRPSGTVRITDAVQKLRSEGRDILAFNAGEPDFDTPPAVVAAAKRALDEGKTHYGSAWGVPELRHAIAEKSKRENNIAYAPANVLVTPAKQAIFYAIMGLIDHGDEVILPDPAWVSYEPIIQLAGGRPVYVTTTLEEDFRLLPERVAEAVTPKTKMMILNSPSNPTGAVSTPADVKGLADVAIDHDLLVLSDELYEHIVYDGTHVSPASLPGMFDRTLTVNGFSKAYAMTGWRLGWLAGPVPILKELIKLQQHSLTHSATFNQYAAVEALTMDQGFLRDMVAEFRARRDLMMNGFQSIPGFEVAKPDGAFYVFPKFAAEPDSMKLTERLLHDGGVAVTPGVEFGPAGEGHLRVSYATSRDTITNGIERIRTAIEKAYPDT